jgi:hypothetical protein
LTKKEFERRCARVDALVALLAAEFDIGFAEMSRLKRSIERYPAKYREMMTWLLREDVDRMPCQRCHGRGSVAMKPQGRNEAHAPR